MLLPDVEDAEHAWNNAGEADMEMAGEAKSLPSRLLSLAWKLCAEDPMSRRADEVESESDFPRLCVQSQSRERKRFLDSVSPLERKSGLLT
jgi:hypothetical protein